MLLTIGGVEINFGLIIGALAAIGSFAAALAAVWVATSGRGRAAKAQARLVLVSNRQLPVATRPGPPPPVVPMSSNFEVQVRNYGGLAILDVRFESVRLRLIDSRWINAPWLEHATLDIVVPLREAAVDSEGRNDSRYEPIVFLDDKYQAVLQQDAEGRWPEINVDTRMVATVTFTDADGYRWRRSSAGLA